MSGLKRIFQFLHGALDSAERLLSAAVETAERAEPSPPPEAVAPEAAAAESAGESVSEAVPVAEVQALPVAVTETVALSEEEGDDDEIDLASQMGDIVPLLLELDKEPPEVPALSEEAAEKRVEELLEREAGPKIDLPPFAQKRAAVSLLKGGVGKTTITCFVATAIQKMWSEAGSGERLLVVDTDPQGSATDFFLQGEKVPPERSLRALFPPYPFPNGGELFRRTRYPNIDILPAHTSMAEVNPSVMERSEDCLAWYLAWGASEYSLVLIDTPPSDTLALRNALMASTGIFMPLDASRQALKTLTQFSQTFGKYKKRNSELKIYGVVFSRYDTRQTLDRNIRTAVSAQLERSGLRLYEVPRRASVSACYNNYTGYEGLDSRRDADICRVFRDMAEQLLSMPRGGIYK